MTDLLSLLGRGYFPRELPAAFSTASFAMAMSGKAKIPESFEKGKCTAKLGVHSLPKMGHDRRVMGIPNPVGQYRLSREIVANWSEIETITGRSTLSKSTPTPNTGPTRAVRQSHAFDDWPRFRLDNRSNARYVLKTDISKCYSSIYTHSIPWAIHGKAYAKVNRGSSDWGNLIDLWSRSIQDDQTKGIPIGPDTSLVIAELILSRIDEEICSSLGPLKGFRYVDDYEFGFRNYSDAEKCLATVRACLKEYELEMNPNKTSIFELPEPIEARWVAPLRGFKFRDSATSQHGDLVTYFNLAFELSRANPSDHVLKYAVSKLSQSETGKPGLKLDRVNWRVVQSFIFQCMVIRFGPFLKALERIIDFHALGFPVDLGELEEILNFQIVDLAESDCGGEVAWAVWALVFFGLQVSPSAGASLSRTRDPIVPILVLDALDRGLIKAPLDTTQWQAIMTTESLRGPNWLLAYEANIRNWLPSVGTGDHIKGDASFNFIKRQGVSFYDSSKTLAQVKAGTPVAEEVVAPLRSMRDPSPQ